MTDHTVSRFIPDLNDRNLSKLFTVTQDKQFPFRSATNILQEALSQIRTYRMCSRSAEDEAADMSYINNRTPNLDKEHNSTLSVAQTLLHIHHVDPHFFYYYCVVIQTYGKSTLFRMRLAAKQYRS